jgi:hypothetical protein
MTFIASGLFHWYPFFVATLDPWFPIPAVIYFFVEATLMLIEDRFQLNNRFFTIAAIVIPSPLLLDPILFVFRVRPWAYSSIYVYLTGDLSVVI